MSALLQVEGLSLEFRTRGGTVHALQDVGLSIAKGETVGLVGESGSGKSVLSYAILGLSDAAARITAGRATFDGMDLLAASEADLQRVRGREVSMIFQNPKVALNPIRKVGHQLEDVLARHTTTLRSQLRERAIACLSEMRIPDPQRRYHAYPFELSGGLCQRVMIALALACGPKLLIADEPTTGLDVTTQAAIMALVREKARSTGMATLLITHDLALAREHCDRIVVMHAGHVVEAAPTQALFDAPLHPYTRLLTGATPMGRASLQDLLAVPGGLPDLRRAGLPLRRALPAAQRRLRRAAAHRAGRRACRALPSPCAAPRAGGHRMSAALLEVTDVAKRFPVRTPQGRAHLHAVDGISLRLEEGETVGLVGESGCGKSTLVRLLTRTLPVSEGQVAFAGGDLAKVDPQAMPRHAARRDVQMVFQDPHDSLNPRYTAFDTIAEPLRLLAGVRDRAQLQRQVEEIATLVGLPRELLQRLPHQLSGGQKARVGIARAAVLRPRLLVLDEPTAALDVSVQVVILQLLARLKAELRMSFLFVSHDLNVVRLLCDRVLVMYLGRIVESGPAAQVFAQPLHPYTRALIASIPGSGRDAQAHLLPGEPQSPIVVPGAGPRPCGFRGRCPHAADACAAMPPLQAAGPGREAACHRLGALPEF
jgi:peptide/nickel transport system ATP-binding protein